MNAKEDICILKNNERAYLDSLKSPLSANEQKVLIRRMLDGDSEAEQLLVETNLKFVVSIASRYIKRTQSFEFMDLIQYGNIGLMEALTKYDEEKENGFTTYAYLYILGRIKKSIAKYDHMIRPTKDIYSDKVSYSKLYNKLKDKKGFVNYQEIAKQMNCSIDYIMKLENVWKSPLSFTHPVSHDGEGEVLLLDVLSDSNNNVENDVLSLDLSKSVEGFLNHSNLSGLQMEILILRNWPIQQCFDQKNTIMSYEEISSIYGVSFQYIAKEEKRAINKLKVDEELDQFVNILDSPTEALKKLELYRQENKKKTKFSKSGRKPVKLQSLLAFLKINKSQYQFLYDRLTEREKKLLHMAYGDNIEHPVRSKDWKCEHVIEFYCIMVPIMKEMLKTYSVDEQCLSDDYVSQMIEVIGSTDFDLMRNVLSDQEAIVLCLTLAGFDLTKIALFLGIQEKEVEEILQYATPIYYEYMDSLAESQKDKQFQKTC